MMRILRAYGRCQLFFVAVSLSWLSGFTSSPPVDPVIDDEAPFRSVLYSATSLAAWVGVWVATAWAATQSDAPVGIGAGLAWGFLGAPVVVVIIMKLLFPGISGRLQTQVDKQLDRARQDRKARKARKAEKIQDQLARKAR
jgi:hypothetical protein